MIDEMEDDDFLDMIFFLMNTDLTEDFDKEFEDEFDKEFENPSSGEMVNFRFSNCQKISAYPIEIVNEIYEVTKSYHCENHNAFPIYYKSTNGKIFES